MLTLTYRENMCDRGRMARDFDVFIKRIRRVLPGLSTFVFLSVKSVVPGTLISLCSGFKSLPSQGVLVRSYDLLRAIWRAVVGEGNIDVSRRCVSEHAASASLLAISRSTSQRASMRVRRVTATEPAVGPCPSPLSSGRSRPLLMGQGLSCCGS